MRELILMRHAEAAPLAADGSDFARPLTSDGAAAATAAGLRLRQQHGLPDLVLHSTALRTTETATAVGTALGLGQRALRADARLYLAPANALLRSIAALPDSAGRVLLVAHNPAVSDLSAALRTDSTRSRAMATAEFRHFTLPVAHWRELRELS